MNLWRAVARSVYRSARDGEPVPQSSVPGARAACPLGAETRLYCPRAAGDGAALSGTAGASGHGAGSARPPVWGGTPGCEGTLGCGRTSARSVTQCMGSPYTVRLHLGVRKLLQFLAAPWRWPLPADYILLFSPSAVLRADSESQGHFATARAPGTVWALGAHLWRQPVSGRGMGRGAEGEPWPLPVY